MSVLGHLAGEGATASVYAVLRTRLAAARDNGEPFDPAWQDACRALHLRHDDAVTQFAKPRFERAYHGNAPSIPMCQDPRHPDCTREAVQDGLCALHAELPVPA